MFDQIFYVIISIKHGIYELPSELPNYLGLRVLGNQEISGEFQIFIESQPNVLFPCKVKSLSIQANNSRKIEIDLFSQCPILFQMETRNCLKQFVHDCMYLLPLTGILNFIKAFKDKPNIVRVLFYFLNFSFFVLFLW